MFKWIYENINEQFVSYLHDSDKERLTDIDPFTVMGIFNRGIKNDNRILIAEEFKKFVKRKYGIAAHRDSDEIEETK